jgi:hypothetical protein
MHNWFLLRNKTIKIFTCQRHFPQIRVGVAVTTYHLVGGDCVQDVSRSNFKGVVTNTDSILLFSWVPPNKCWNITSITSRPLFRDLFQFIIHQSTYNSTPYKAPLIASSNKPQKRNVHKQFVHHKSCSACRETSAGYPWQTLASKFLSYGMTKSSGWLTRQAVYLSNKYWGAFA